MGRVKRGIFLLITLCLFLFLLPFAFSENTFTWTDKFFFMPNHVESSCSDTQMCTNTGNNCPSGWTKLGSALTYDHSGGSGQCSCVDLCGNSSFNEFFLDKITLKSDWGSCNDNVNNGDPKTINWCGDGYEPCPVGWKKIDSTYASIESGGDSGECSCVAFCAKNEIADVFENTSINLVTTDYNSGQNNNFLKDSTVHSCNAQWGNAACSSLQLISSTIAGFYLDYTHVPPLQYDSCLGLCGATTNEDAFEYVCNFTYAIDDKSYTNAWNDLYKCCYGTSDINKQVENYVCKEEPLGWKIFSGDNGYCEEDKKGDWEQEALKDNNYLSSTGADGCCGDDNTSFYPNGDLGYIDPVNKLYFCNKDANSAVPPGIDNSVNSQWYWWNAQEDSFKIHQISSLFDSVDKNVSCMLRLCDPIPCPPICHELNCMNKIDDDNDGLIDCSDPDCAYACSSNDVISNGDEWFFCNATGTVNLNGNSVTENGTFSPEFPNGKVSCSDALTNIFGSFPNPYGKESFSTQASCDNSSFDYTRYGCCELNEGKEPTTTPGSALQDCQDICFIGLGVSVSQFCKASNLCGSVGQTQQTQQGSNEYDLPLNQCKYGECIEATEWDPSKSCTEQNPNYFHQFCPDEKSCYNGTYISTLEGGTINNSCCYGKGAQCKYYDSDLTCAQNGGQIFDTQNQRCDGFIPQGTNCCFGVIETLFQNFNKDISSSFICTKQNLKNKFFECCYDTNCYNKNLSGKFVGTGGVFHTIYNFDDFTSGILENRVRVYTNRDSSNPVNIYLSSFVDFSLKDFDYLEFEIFFNNNAIDKIYLSNESMGDIRNYLTSFKGPGRWHHAIVPLNGKDSREITFTFKAGPSAMMIDNIHLSSKNDDVNSFNWYCSGGFGTWVKELDSTAGADFATYGPNKAACEAQASFGWTGHYCCGDDTGIDINDMRKYEFFVDTENGCFNGTTIRNGLTLSNETGEDGGEDLLFYNGEFWVCDNNNAKYDSVKISHDGKTQEAGTFATKVDEFTVKGSWYCEDQKWQRMEKIKKTRLLAAYLYNISIYKGDDAVLVCDKNSRTLINLDKAPAMCDDNNFCALKYYTGDGKVILGKDMCNNEDPNSFIESYVQTYYPLNDTSITVDCSKVDNNEFVFQRCDSSDHNKLDVYYNKDYKLIILAQQDISDKVGQQSKNILTIIWNFLKNLFESLFGSREQSQLGPEFKFADFERLYINQKGTKLIRAVYENGELSGEYSNFNNVEMGKLFSLISASEKNSTSNSTMYRLWVKNPSDNDWFMLTSKIRLE